MAFKMRGFPFHEPGHVNERKVKIKAKELTFKGKKYAFDPKTRFVYDLDSYLQGNPRKVGDLIVRGKRSGIRFI